MAIPVVFLTMVVRKADLQNCHPNWLVWFQEHYPSHYQDEYLVGQCSMSSGEVQGMVDLLPAYGIPENRIAVVDIIHGILEPNETPLGTADDIRALSRDEVVRVHSTWFSPSSTTIVNGGFGSSTSCRFTPPAISPTAPTSRNCFSIFASA